MDFGYVRVAAAIPNVRVADCFYNIDRIEYLIREAESQDVQIISFPELSVTGYTCMDLFAQQTLIRNAEKALVNLVEKTADVSVLSIVGMPLMTENRLVNAAVAFQSGKILGVVPKSYIPNYKEFQEQRWFTSGNELHDDFIIIDGNDYPISKHILFASGNVMVGIEICEDAWVPVPPSSLLCMEGANIIFNLSASNEVIGKHQYRLSLVKQQSARCIAGYVYSGCGFGESTTDLVFSGNAIIAENGSVLELSDRFCLDEQLIISEIDVDSLMSDRMVNTNFMKGNEYIKDVDTIVIPFKLNETDNTTLSRKIDAHPFVPQGDALQERCEEILKIQINGLAKRIDHTKTQTAVIGISGGLDSTLALLVTALTFDKLGISRERILGITMPGFGTTDRTYNNAINLIKSLGITFREVSIRDACLQHFSDIGHDVSNHDITYENTQARERTQILMDIANKENGMVIGTGDLSELALGWATYNGDHMSMYGVNCSIPKTLVKYLVQWIALNNVDDNSKVTLLDIIDTPISPELIPADDDGNITQKTEDLVGPYELHDFFLYHALRFGSSPAKIFFLAQTAFGDKYGKETIKKWLHTFFRRFFAQQFKRSCLPDGPKVGSVSLSPRGDWRMPSDAAATIWLNEIERL
jgi:NAD+ synthetase